MASGIALGMNYLHTARDRPLIHGDLKMKNVLISDGFKPKVSDVRSLESVFFRCRLETVFECVVHRQSLLSWSWPQWPSRVLHSFTSQFVYEHMVRSSKGLPWLASRRASGSWGNRSHRFFWNMYDKPACVLGLCLGSDDCMVMFQIALLKEMGSNPSGEKKLKWRAVIVVISQW